MNTNHESVAYRSFSPSKFEARGARKVTTGISQLSLERRCCSFCATENSPNHKGFGVASGSGNVRRGYYPYQPSRGDREPSPSALKRSVRCRVIRPRTIAFGTSYSCPKRVPVIQELACGSQAFIATLLFDPSMSALPIIPKQNSVSVGLFTH